ncbi:MAG: hypothetical protein WC726_00260 [Parcubacteria group bacterium]
MTAFVAMVFAVSFVTVALAGRSDLLSESELNEIELVAQAAYPRGTQFDMVVGDDILGRYALIEFITKAKTKRQSLEIMVYPLTAYAEMSSAESDEVGERVGVKIIEGIEKIINKSPRQSFRNILK